jgi:2-keto-4-pentenoate hydratase/2-oxohepta-3-ene-1,7-dioic acid hydratase in catechol pathway
VSLPAVQPRSLRCFSVYEEHNVAAARTLVKRFWPKPAGVAVGGFERITRRTFPALKPGGSFFSEPSFYVGNHTAVVGDGEELPWPSHTDYLDFELELGFVLAEDVADASPAEAEAAIGGFFVVNDWSARDVQAHEYREGMFGPAVKSKSFATGISPDSADVLGRWDSLRATARVNGETWSETSTAGAAHSPGDLVAFASRGERLGAGDAFAMGTLPRGCGLELDRWLKPGYEVSLEIEGVGTLTNRVGERS